MPALFALGQCRALVVAQAGMHPTTKLVAFHDDVSVVTNPARVAAFTHLASREAIEPSSHRVAGRFIFAARAAGGHTPRTCGIREGPVASQGRVTRSSVEQSQRCV